MERQAQYRLEVLGGTRLRAGAQAVPLTAAESRLLTGLALAGAVGATDERLMALLWSAGPPRTAKQSLRNHVFRLRDKAGGSLLRRMRSGYRLGFTVTVDVRELEGMLAAALAAHDRGDAAMVIELADGATAMAVGAAFADLSEDRTAAGARARLEEELLQTEELCATGLLRSGQLDRAVADLQRLVRMAPARETRWELLLAVLGQTGRRSEALGVYHEARRVLIEAHGVEPSNKLRRLHDALLHASVPKGTRGELDRAVGRDDDVAAIIDRTRAGGATVVTGRAGIGKSTVLGLVARAWQGPTVMLDCQENPWTALGPVQDLLERLADPLEALQLPNDLSRLRPTTGEESWDRPRRHGGLISRVVEVITAGFGALGPVLVVVDDVERAGPTTREILVTAIHRAGVPAVFASRQLSTDVLGPLEPAEHHLCGLDVDALAHLASQRIDAIGDDPAIIARWLHAHTGGNPMFAVELLRAAMEQRPWADSAAASAILQPDALHGVVLPESLVASLEQRLARLPAHCQPALDAAAVMGSPIDLSLLRRLVDVGLLAPLIDAEVLTQTGNGQMRFPHSLLGRVAYDRVPAGRRAELHHAIGLLSTDPTRRAHHLSHGIALDPHAAVAAMVAAGRAAVSQQAYADAAQWFERALRHATTAGLSAVQTLDLRLEACDSAHLAGRPGHAEPLLDLAEEVLEAGHLDLRRRATVAAVQLGEAVDPGPLQGRAAQLVDRAVAIEQDAAWRARLNATGSILHSMTSDTARCRDMFLAALEDLEPDDDALACDVLPYAYMSLGHPDDLALREALAEQLLAAAVRMQDHQAQWEANHLRFSTSLVRGDGSGLRLAVAEAQRLLVHAGDAGRRWSVGYMRAALAAIDGRYEEAEQLSAEAMTVGAGVAPGRAMSVWSAQLLALRWEQDRLDELGDTIRYLIEAQPEIAAWQGAGCLILAESDPEMAVALFDRAATDDFADLPRDFAWLVGMLVLAGGAARLGDAERAAVVAPHLAPYTDLVCWQGSCSYGPVAAVAADLADLCGDTDRADQLRTQAGELRRTLAAGAPGVGPAA